MGDPGACPRAWALTAALGRSGALLAGLRQINCRAGGFRSRDRVTPRTSRSLQPRSRGGSLWKPEAIA